MNYTVYHLHSMLSNGVTNIDSITNFRDYVKAAQECGMTAMAFSEHGNIFEWLHKKEVIEAAGMKYIHAIEAYLTENIEQKERDNYHCVLIARNYDGVKELNRMISKSFNRNDGHFYYMPRVTLDELFATSDNILITTACLGGVLHNGTPTAKERMLSFLKKNRDRCYLEIQHHNCEDQIAYNKLLYDISRELEIPLIAGTDTHALNDEHMSGRAMLQKAKGVRFASEDEWDLTFKTYEQLVEAYRKQDSLPMDVVLEAIENTNQMAERIEPFTLDYGAKYPKLYEDSEAVFKKKINEGVKKRGIQAYPNYRQYVDRIHEEYETYKHNGAIDFMLLEEDYKSEMRRRGVRFGYSRGSVSGSIIAYLLGVTEVDSVKYDLNFSRFMNRERVSLADVDTDWFSDDRKTVKDYLYTKRGLYCCDIVTFNTIAMKGAVNDVVRGFFRDNTDHLPDEIKAQIDAFKKAGGDEDNIPPELAKLIEKHSIHREVPTKYLDFSNKVNAMIEEDEEGARKKYPDLFRYVDMVNGCVVSVGNHPAGCVVSPYPVDEWFGTFSTATDEYPISQLNMKEIDALNFVKLDILGLDNVGLIYKTCDLAGIPYLTPDNTPPDDMDVWNSIRDDTTLIFQWESQSATAYLKQLFSPTTIAKIREKNPNFSYMDLLSIGNGAIRPAGESYRDALANGDFKDNGSEELNKFLAPTLGYLVYQCEIIEFLHKFCGFTMGEADIVRRCVDENSMILMWGGETKLIKDVKVGDYIASYDGKSLRRQVVQNVFDNGLAVEYELMTSNGCVLKATLDHKVMTMHGWVELGDLKLTDEIPYAGYVQHVIPCGRGHVYDLEVSNTHNYVANGIIVHNCFSKKTGTEGAIPIIKDGGILNEKTGHQIKGFIQTMKDDYGVEREDAERIIVSFLKVIEDASDYLFSKNHADPYSWIGYICGYLRYHYPLEFITTALNIFEDNSEKTLAVINYAKRHGLRISPIKFRHSIAKYSCDRETNEIFKGIASIKYMNAAVADEMYALRNNAYETFMDLLYDLDEKTTLNSRQLKILIDLDFFVEFGDANMLNECARLYTAFGGRKQIKKDKLASEGLNEEVARPFAEKESEKMFSGVDMRGFLCASAKQIKVSGRTLKQSIAAQIEHLGYIDIAEPRYSGMAAVLDIDTKYSPKVKLHSLKNGTLMECKIDRRKYNRDKLKQGDIIRVLKTSMRQKMKRNDDGEFEPIPGQFERWITDYKQIEL